MLQSLVVATVLQPLDINKFCFEEPERKPKCMHFDKTYNTAPQNYPALGTESDIFPECESYRIKYKCSFIW